jgi:GMP synthase (glutamine-hydrolysing)
MTEPQQFLLLQARKVDDQVARHELECFVESLAVSHDAVAVHDLLSGAPSDAQLEQVDMLLIGGSGDFSVLDNEPFIHAFLDFMSSRVIARSFPTFCSCFGFQALVLAGGGEVIRDAVNTEVGSFEIQVNSAGAGDSLLGSLAPRFYAQLGHKDRATRLPAGMTSMASSERCPHQALRVDGTQVFATQFHPELSKDANIYRYLRYREGYARGGNDPGEDRVLSSMKDTPSATALLPRWVKEVQGKKAN